jgi:foldase protein PrsA
MKLVKFTLALGAFFVAAIGLSACGSGVAGNSVADMAGNPITTGAFDHWMYVEAASNAAQSPGAPVIVAEDPPQFNGCITQVRRQIASYAKKSDKELRSDCRQLFSSTFPTVMRFLITAYWIQAEAARQNLKVTDTQVQQEFVKEKHQAYPDEPQFQAFLRQSGQTLQDIMFRVRVSLIQQKLIAKYTQKVTPAQIRAYYSSHPSQFGSPETRDIRIVLTKTLSSANAAKSALSKHQSWSTVAKKYSTDPTSKNNGGLLTGVSKGQQDSALDSAAFAAPPGKLLGPVKGQFGYYVFEVTKITKATQQSLTQAAPLIQQQLSSQQQSTAASTLSTTSKKHWQAKTKCRAQFMMEYCAGYKAPKTSTLAPPGTT